MKRSSVVILVFRWYDNTFIVMIKRKVFIMRK